MELSIKKFQNGHFGNLTSLKSERTGKVMFVAKEVCELWGHTNSTKAIKDAKLTGQETMVLKRNEHVEFFNLVTNQQLVTNKTHSIQLISESGLYKLALNSKKEEADLLKHWIANDVLPSLREKGKYIMPSTVTNLKDHNNVSVQKKNSIDINSVNFKNGGVPEMIEYNTKSCIAITGKKPREIKQIGKDLGLKSYECTSSKQVLRHIRPELACTMSFVDNEVKQGKNFDTAMKIGKKYAAPLFKAMLEAGFMPGELSM